MVCGSAGVPALVNVVGAEGADIFGKRYLGLGIDLLAALANSPSLAAEGTRKRPARVPGTPELWTPRTLGANYRAQEARREGTDPAGEEHRPHWRRGHWRNQPVGEGRKSRKLIGLELAATEYFAEGSAHSKCPFCFGLNNHHQT